MKKLIAIVLSLALTPFGAAAGFSAEAETLESLKEKAVASSVDLLAMTQGMETLMENLEDLQDSEEGITEFYEAYKTYERLHKAGAGLIPDPPPVVPEPEVPGETEDPAAPGEAVDPGAAEDPLEPEAPGTPEDPAAPPVPPSPPVPTPEQIAMKQAYLQLQALFLDRLGIATPSLSDEEIYDNFIYPVEVLPNKLIDQYASLRIDRERVTSMLEGGVEALWWNMGALGTQKRLIEEYVSLLEVQLEADKVRYSLGKISELQFEAKNLELEVTQRDQVRLDRESENLDYRMRSLAGIEFKEPFSVKLLPITVSGGEIKTYEALLTESLRTRADAIRALRQVFSIRQELDVMEEWFDDDEPRYRAVEMSLLRAEEAYEATVRSVDADLYAAYDAALTKKEALENARGSYDLAMLDLDRVKALHSVGYVSDVDLTGAEMGLKQALLALESSVYQYNLAHQTLDRTVQYGSGTGGMGQ
ncbi:TolC family protein [Acidaminobacter hydrogenoformans]|uniref:Outer membrane efflux protein n=1 Tax=Acidaminobacter hydrogenoformans DSM 2784 TaxID=1120920 RepID=A0A1G5RYF5_9FIRM|nr:TolC family protein [Acidaminobacter hydrogenoformans]SCZ79036.1 Outer membrane efflux protein [Acidaminobacter hydrogenoformans DSM 2784]